ncbi:TetR family transcriptional regulator [Actinoallomurus bryophytorum]|uniref:TetR family transcriptional regulator n=1 Tax=Actinoallomurus bryophytorum TaxID=1490222 RepID=A0A543BTB9_9ACTN|nr:TetR family transcriptional regulator [Actinoallomurus bryophytorum]
MRGARAVLTRKPRTDAKRDRGQIVAVARAAFAAEGLDLPVREIARRAGLGVATVYRHFPSRSDLISAVLVEQVTLCGAEMRAALADPDPWRALSGTIRRFAERQVSDRGLNEALLGSHAAGAPFAEQRRAHAGALARLVERARSAGAVRDGVSVEDVRVGLLAIASFRALPAEKAAAATQRLANLLLAGLSQRQP